MGADGEIAEEDEFGERAGVIEVGAGFATVDDVVSPLALGVVWHDTAFFGLFDFAGFHIEAHFSVAGFVVDDGAGAVGFAFEDGAFGADEHHTAAGLIEGFFGEFAGHVRGDFGLIGRAVLHAVMPGDFEGLVFASGHVIDEGAPLGGAGRADGAADGVDFFGDELAEDGEGSVHDVAAHVTEGAGAELPPAAPGEGMDAVVALPSFDAFGHDHFEVGFGGFSGEPEVPVEIGWGVHDLFFEGVLGPDGAIGPEADFLEVTDGALFDPLFGEALAFHGAALVAHLGDEFGVGGGLVKVANFGDVVAEGLLDADVFAVLDGMHGGGVVGVVRGGDDDGVDVLGHLIEHFTEVFVEFGGWGSLFARVEVMFFALFGGFIEAILIHVHESDDVVAESDSLGIGLAFAVGADDGDIEALASGVLAPKEEVRGGEQACGEGGGGADEVAA